MICSLHESVTIAVFINIVNCGGGGDDDDDDGSDGISIKKFWEMHFTPCVVILVIKKILDYHLCKIEITGISSF